MLKGYGKTYPKDSTSYPAAIIVVCDLDDQVPEDHSVRNSSMSLMRATPNLKLVFASPLRKVRHGSLVIFQRSSLLIDQAKETVLKAYENDSICGTWEILADAISPGGAKALKKEGWQAVGARKNQIGRKRSPPSWMSITTPPPALATSDSKSWSSPELVADGNNMAIQHRS